MIVLRRRILIGPVFIPHFLQICGGIKCIVCMPIIYQLHCILAVYIFSLALAVRSVWSTVSRAFMRLQPAPFKAAVYIFFSACNVSCLVSIFDPKDELPPQLVG